MQNTKCKENKIKIISQFKDYYDGVQGTALDASVRFIRTCSMRMEQIPGLPWNEPDPKTNNAVGIRHRSISCYPYGTYSNITFFQGLIVVGPKCYPMWIHTENLFAAINQEDPKSLFDAKSTFACNSIESFVEELYKKKIEQYTAETNFTFVKEFEIRIDNEYRKFTNDGWIETKSPNGRSKWRAKYFQKKDTTEENLYNQALEKILQKDFTDVCMQLETPVFVLIPHPTLVDRRSWYQTHGDAKPNVAETYVMLNPFLKLFDFHHVVDPFTVFQEISMFIGGRMPGAQSPMVTISDKSQIRKKGFDEKYGFRTRPTKI